MRLAVQILAGPHRHARSRGEGNDIDTVLWETFFVVLDPLGEPSAGCLGSSEDVELVDERVHGNGPNEHLHVALVASLL